MIRDLSIQLVSAWHDTSWVEIIAAALAVAYLLLAIRQRIELLGGRLRQFLPVRLGAVHRPPVHGVRC